MESVYVFETGDDNKTENIIDEFIDNNKDLFIFFYLDDCGPCITTKPEWDKINIDEMDKNNIVVMRINQMLKNEGNITTKYKDLFNFNGFPYIVHVKKEKGSDNPIVESYDTYFDNNNNNKESRSIESFNDWIQYKTKSNSMGGKKIKSKCNCKCKCKCKSKCKSKCNCKCKSKCKSKGNSKNNSKRKGKRTKKYKRL